MNAGWGRRECKVGIYMSSRGWTRCTGMRVLLFELGVPAPCPPERGAVPQTTHHVALWMRGIAPVVLLLLHCAAGFTSRAPAVVRRGSIISSSDNRRPSSSPSQAGAESSIMASSTGGAAAADLEIKSETACFGGRLLKCVHQSKATKTPMTFTVFLPPAAASSAVPVCIYTVYTQQVSLAIDMFGIYCCCGPVHVHTCNTCVVACCRCLELLLPSTPSVCPLYFEWGQIYPVWTTYFRVSTWVQ